MPNSSIPKTAVPAKERAGSQKKKRQKNEPELHICARNNDAEGILDLLTGGAAPNEESVRFARTPLMAAALMGHLEATKALLGASDLSLRDAHGLDALSHAATSGDIAVFNLILAAALEVSEDPDSGKTPLHHAALWQRTEIVKLLLPLCDPNHKDAFGATPLHLACFDLSDVEPGCSKDTECARLLAAAAVAQIDEPNEEGLTPLHYAARHNRWDCVRALLSAGADADLRDHEGNTPLLAAVKSGSLEAASDLLAVSDASARDKEGNTALLIAADCAGTEELVKLLATPEDAKATNDRGETPLLRASMKNNIEAMRILVPLSDVNAKSKDGDSALMYAFWGASVPGIELLAPLTNRSGRGSMGRSFVERVLSFTNSDALSAIAPHLSNAELEEMAMLLMKERAPELGAKMEGHFLRLAMAGNAGPEIASAHAANTPTVEMAASDALTKKPSLRM